MSKINMSIYSLVLLLMFSFCKNKMDKKVNNYRVQQNEVYNKLLKHSLNYNAFDRENWLPYNAKANSIYPLDDSLNKILKQISPDSIIDNQNFRILFILLLEKYYLYIYKSSKNNRNNYSVYNAHLWNPDLYWLNYSLNIFMKRKLNNEESVVDYGWSTVDNIFIENIIEEGNIYRKVSLNKEFILTQDSCLKIYPSLIKKETQ